MSVNGGNKNPGWPFDPANPPAREWQLSANLFAPKNGIPIDIDETTLVEPGSNEDILIVECPQNQWLYITHYALLTTISDLEETKESLTFKFFMGMGESINNRILPWHGNSTFDVTWPTQRSNIWARGATNFSNENLRMCNIKLAPMQKLRVVGYSTGQEDAQLMGVRLVGYISEEQYETDSRF